MIDDRISIVVLNNEVDLDRLCWNCSGHGKDKAPVKNSPFWTDDGECEICDGIGYELTDTGRAILKFLKRHEGHNV